MNNKKPFNREKALAGEPVINGRGEKVSQLKEYTLRDKSNRYCLCGVLESTNRGGKLVEQLSTYTALGAYYYPRKDEELDLYMDYATVISYVPLYMQYGEIQTGGSYLTEEEAITRGKALSPDTYLRVIKLTEVV